MSKLPLSRAENISPEGPHGAAPPIRRIRQMHQSGMAPIAPNRRCKKWNNRRQTCNVFVRETALGRFARQREFRALAAGQFHRNAKFLAAGRPAISEITKFCGGGGAYPVFSKRLPVR